MTQYSSLWHQLLNNAESLDLSVCQSSIKVTASGRYRLLELITFADFETGNLLVVSSVNASHHSGNVPIALTNADTWILDLTSMAVKILLKRLISNS